MTNGRRGETSSPIYASSTTRTLHTRSSWQPTASSWTECTAVGADKGLRVAAFGGRLVRLNRRADGNYDGWGLHLWDGAANPTDWAKPLAPAKVDAFGAVFEVPLAAGATSLSYILHNGDVKDLPTDQSLDFAKAGREVWLTIDDGPEPESSPLLMEALLHHGVKEEESFVVGKVLSAEERAVDVPLADLELPEAGLPDDGRRYEVVDGHLELLRHRSQEKDARARLLLLGRLRRVVSGGRGTRLHHLGAGDCRRDVLGPRFDGTVRLVSHEATDAQPMRTGLGPEITDAVGLEEVALHVVGVRHAARLLDHLSEHEHAGVAVLPPRAGLEGQRLVVRAVDLQDRDRCGRRAPGRRRAAPRARGRLRILRLRLDRGGSP